MKNLKAEFYPNIPRRHIVLSEGLRFTPQTVVALQINWREYRDAFEIAIQLEEDAKKPARELDEVRIEFDGELTKEDIPRGRRIVNLHRFLLHPGGLEFDHVLGCLLEQLIVPSATLHITPHDNTMVSFELSYVTALSVPTIFSATVPLEKVKDYIRQV